MKTILIMITLSGFSGKAVNHSQSIEFDNPKACEKAITKLNEAPRKGQYLTIVAICTSKD